MAKGNTTKRTRNWAFVFYPESCPENWLDILDDTHIPMFISPLHDKDVNPDIKEDGSIENKKAHYHCLLMFEGVKTQEQAQAISNLVNGVLAIPVESVRGYARYLCHLDNPEKFIYERDDVICLAGTDYRDAVNIPTDDVSMLMDILAYIRDNHIVWFNRFMDYCMNNNMDWFRFITKSYIFVVKEYMKSMDNEDKAIMSGK